METRIIKLDAENVDIDVIKDAATVLDSGGLVAFPTETVYGIGCRVRCDSLARLDELKGRPAEKFYTLHIANPADAAKYVPVLGLRAKKLIENAWPGPLTIVFELSEKEIEIQKNKLADEVFACLYKDNSIGIRCPAHRIASMLLAEAKSEAVAPSANASGQAPAVEVNQIVAQLSGKIEIILDGGPCMFKTSSTVVKLQKSGLSVLRQGVYPEPRIIEMATVTILFVCTGNSCRSPMAEGLFRKHLAEKLDCTVDRLAEKGYNITSAGTMGIVGFPATEQAIKACADRGVDITGHRSHALNRYLIEQSDIIYALTARHRDYVLEISPDAADKCLLLAENEDITDPIGQPQGVYDTCARVIDKAVKKRLDNLVL